MLAKCLNAHWGRWEALWASSDLRRAPGRPADAFDR